MANPAAEHRLGNGTFTVETVHGTVLAVNPVAHRLIHARVAGPEMPPALLHTTAASPLAFILFDNPSLQPLFVREQAAPGPIVVVRRRPLAAGTFAFVDPCRGANLTAHAGVGADGTGLADFGSYELGEWQRFKLGRNLSGTLSPAIVHQITLIERVVTTPPVCILDLLRNTSAGDRPALTAIMTEAISPTDVELLADYLFDDRTRLADLASLIPGDPWADTGLPALWSFIQKRRRRAALRPYPSRQDIVSTDKQSATRVIGPELDRLAAAGLGGEYASLPHRCTIAIRRRTAPTRDICIVATARNDGLYLLDWLAYHRAIRVEKVFLYTNDNVDGSDRLMRALAAAGEISLIESHLTPSGVSPVSKAYGHALSMVPEVLDYRWCAIIDSDELIGLDRSLFNSITEYLAWQELQPVDSIVLSWLVFGSSGASRWRDEPLPRRFIERYPDSHIKSIFRPREFHHAMPHFPHSDHGAQLVCRDARGQPFPYAAAQSPTPLDGPAWIAHYFFRSFEEFVWKFSRGRGDQPLHLGLPELNVPEPFMASFVAQQTQLSLTRDDRLLAFADEASREAERLRALPGVAEALAEIHAYYRRRSDVLEPMLRQVRSGVAGKQAEFLDLFLNPAATC